MSTMQPFHDDGYHQRIAKVRNLVEQGILTKEEALTILEEMDESMSRDSKTLMDVLNEQVDISTDQLGREMLAQFGRRMRTEPEAVVQQVMGNDGTIRFEVVKNREPESIGTVTVSLSPTGQPIFQMTVDPAVAGGDRTAVQEVPKEPEVQAPEVVEPKAPEQKLTKEPVVDEAECICDGSGWSQSDEFDERIPCPRCNPFMH